MASIDEVIERSRQPGAFGERKKFTVARSRAIQKMRQFALADSSHYVLEWIQAAVANGATYLDLSIEQNEVRMSYVGGGYSREELEALFDFLFASKDDLDIADVRQLALGVNALLGADPEAIIIESGDGTLAGTTRVELDGKSDAVYVGTPTRPLAGTFVKVTGLRRDWGDPRELAAIEERCLTATIPILVNDEPLFGYTAVRSPDLFGYRRTLKFDEGDLYGTLGIATTPITRNFKLLTWGTWITTTRYEFPDLPPMGGVVGYDRLRKTADHASIVQDEVYQEMWARLATYARQLSSGQTGTASFDVSTLGGTALSAQAFRTLARERRRAVIFLREAVATDEARGLAARYGEAFEAPVFITSARDFETVRQLGGPDVEVHTPRLDARELRFFERPVTSDPPRPWLAAAVDVPDISAAALADRLDEVDTAAARVVAAATRTSGGVLASVFSPAACDRDVELKVELRVARRSVWTGSVESEYPGHHVVVDLDDLPLEVLEKHPTAALLLAQVAVEHARVQLAEATGRVIEAIRPGVPLSPAARRVVLGVVSRMAVTRLRRGTNGVAVRFALESDALPSALLQLGIVETVDRQLLSIDDIANRLPRTCGMVFAVRSIEAVNDEYDRSQILWVDGPTSRMLELLLGRLSYVEFDANHASGSADAIECDELAVGVKLADSPPQMTESVAERLLHAWRAGGASPRVMRHLVWFAAHGSGATHAELAAEPLFRTADGRRTSLAEIRPLLQSEDGLPMYDGWSGGPTSSPDDGTDHEQETTALAMDSFVFHALSRIGEIRPILDVDLTTQEAGRSRNGYQAAFIERERVSEELDGEIGLPMERVSEPVVLWLDRRRGTAIALRELGHAFGVVGRIHGSSAMDRETVESQVVAACLRLYDRLIRRLSSIADPTEAGRAVELLLAYCARHVRINEAPDGSLSVATVDPLAMRILELPVFPTTVGVAATPWRMLREFATYGDRNPRPGRAQLVDDAPQMLEQWLDGMLDRGRITRGDAASPTMAEPSELDVWLTDALHAVRTDHDDGRMEVRVMNAQEFAAWSGQFGSSDAELFVQNQTIYINADSWLVRGIRVGDTPDSEGATWLLLAIYARLNRQRLSVTNVHELHFQSRILDWLGPRRGDA